jgi:hypothetical protein
MPERELAHPLSWWRFYLSCLRHAGTGVLGVIGDASTVLGVAAIGCKAVLPSSYAVAATYFTRHGYSDNWLIWIPFFVGLGVLFLRLVVAPFVIYKDKPMANATAFAPVTDDELRRRVEALVRQMREFEKQRTLVTRREYGHNQPEATSKRAARERVEIEQNALALTGEATFLRNEILQRLREPIPSRWTDGGGVFFDGSLAGVSAIGEAATYLEVLSRRLNG